MVSVKRRKFLALTGSIPLFAGCSGSSNQQPSGGGKRPDASREDLVHQSELLKHVLESNTKIDFDRRHLFVGNPNYFDFGLSSIELSDNNGYTTIEDGIENGLSAEEIWTKHLDSVGETEETVFDGTANDLLDYDILENGELDVQLLNSTSLGYLEDAFTEAFDSIEQNTGIDFNLGMQDTRRFSRDEMINIGLNNPDTFVLHVYSELDRDYGVAAPDGNIAMINSNAIESRDSPRESAPKVFEHEAYHALNSLPHLLYPGENLMSVSTADPSEAELTNQSRDMIDVYMSSELKYESSMENGIGKINVGFEPTHEIPDGERYLEQNTRFVLDELDFPTENWDIDTDEDVARLHADGIVVELHPDTYSGYERVNVY